MEKQKGKIGNFQFTKQNISKQSASNFLTTFDKYQATTYQKILN